MRQWDILEYPSEKSSSSTSSGLSGGSLSRIIDEKLGGKAQRKKKDSGWRIDERAHHGDIEVFLSDLPEEIDIRYRTKFIVVGSQAKLLVRRACKSTAACELRPKHEEAPVGNLTLDPGMLSQAVEKFLLNPGMDEMQLLEALSVGSDSVLDRPGGSGEGDCPENCYCTVPPIYSRKASKAEQDSDQAEAPWKTRLSEWELQHGALSKFGPVDMEDLDAIHAAFTHISGKMLKQSIHGKTSMLKSCNWDKQNSFRAKWSVGSGQEAKQRPDLAKGPLSAKGFAGMYSCARKALGRG